MSSESLHERAETLGDEAIDLHRAIVSVMEEFEAVDWYNQRAKATTNPELRAILEHNRDEEKEHAAMVLEWLRRSDPTLAKHLKTFLFREGPITGIEADELGGVRGEDSGEGGDGGEGEPSSVADDGSLGIGSLRKAGGGK